MATEERSAGVILHRADAAAPLGRVFLLLDYGRYWDYPKGHVEHGEDDVAAALRELKEETGVTGATVSPDFRHALQYFFRDRHKGLIRKTVVFFLAETGQAEVTISHEHESYDWLAYAAARGRLTYPNARAALDAAAVHLGLIDAVPAPEPAKRSRPRRRSTA